MTAVLLLGDIPSMDVIKGARAERVAGGPAVPDLADTFLPRVSAALSSGEAALVLYPSWRAAETRRIVTLARGAFDTDRIAGIGLRLPPLGLSLVADQLAFLAPYIKPGALATMAYSLADNLVAGAWLNSVARLEHIDTGIGKHAASYLPSSGFMATVAPAAAVHRITGSDPIGPMPHRMTDPVLLFASHQGGDLKWLTEKLQPAMRAVSLTYLPVQPLSQPFWGTKRYVEFVAFSGHQHDMQTLVRATRYRPCGWCAEPIGLESCPFCAMVQPQPAAPPPPTPQAVHPQQAQPQAASQQDDAHVWPPPQPPHADQSGHLSTGTALGSKVRS